MVLYATPIRKLMDEVDIPTDFLDASDSTFADLLNRIYFTDYTLTSGETSLGIVVGLLIDGELALGLPGLDGFAFVFGSDGGTGTLIEVDCFFSEQGTIVVFGNTSLSLRFPPSILRPVPPAPGDPTPPFAQVVMQGSFILDGNGNVSVEGLDAISLAPAMIGDTGVIISADDVKVDFSRTETLTEVAAAGFDETFMGIYIGEAQVTLPPDWPAPVPTDLVLRKAVIGTGGVGGIVEAHYTPAYDPGTKTFTGPGATTLAGFPFGLTTFVIELKQNALVRSQIAGQIVLPVFDQPVAVEVTVGLDGTLSLALSAAQPPGVPQTPEGLLRLSQAGVFQIDVDSFKFDLAANGFFLVHLSGQLTPLFQPFSPAPFAWPSFRVDDLGIDSDGKIHFSGGWIDLPSQVTLSLFGFLLEITRFGFGETDQGERWIGFNGGLKIMEGVPAGASVEGLRILWGGPGGAHISLEGVGVELEVPGAVRLSGKVSLVGQELKGAVRVELPAISFVVDGQFVAGSVHDPDLGRDITSFAVFLEMQLPAGIPLGPTGLALYGVAGLYAHNRKPAKGDAEGWYRNPDLSDGWYTRGDPDGITDVGNKWKAAQGGLGLGAGIILGTFPDNGFIFNGRLLLVLSFPGPVILIEGMANLFKKRSALGGDEANFRALLVIEPKKSFTVGMDAQYKFGSGGELMEIRGSAEAFFDYNDPTKWHIYLGIDDPRERRIRARIFSLFDVNAFFMLDPRQLKVGAGWSFYKRWGFKVLSVTLSASMEGQATVSWHPVHFTGSLAVEGSAELRAFGIGLGISVGATISGDVFAPFGLRGEFRAGINLPWPLPDVKAKVVIEWKEELHTPPPLPVPMREASIEHLKSGNTWPLVRGQSLVYDDGGGAFEFERPGGDPHPTVPDDVAPGDATFPNIPSDSKVALTFTRPVDDPGFIAWNPNRVEAEQIGVPMPGERHAFAVGYQLASLDLQQWAPGDETTFDGAPRWVTVRTGGTPLADGGRLDAAWVPGKEIPEIKHSEQTKLVVNALTPFDYTAGRSDSWQEWFAEANPGYPCSLAQPGLSARFTQELGTLLAFPVVFDPPAFTIDNSYGGQVVENEEVIATVLGPIDRGMIMTVGNTSIFPPSGEPSVLLRIGTPKELVGAGATFFDVEDASVPNPFAHSFAQYSAYDRRGAGGSLLDHLDFVTLSDGSRALEIRERLEIALLNPIVYVELELQITTTGAPGYELFAVDFDGVEGIHRPVVAGRSKLRLPARAGISRLVVRRTTSRLLAPRLYLARITVRRPERVLVDRLSGPPLEFFEGSDGVIRIDAPGMTHIRFQDFVEGGATLLEMALPAGNQELVRHTQASLSRLTTPDDPLFTPDNDYRLVARTVRDAAPTSGYPEVLRSNDAFVHHAYFRVVAPPGIGVPDRPPESESTGASFTNLRLYVGQTVPPTVPDEGDKLLLPRAFYRGYDVAVQFNETYTELMYLRARRSLTTRVYDLDGNPALQPDGRVAIPTPSWERDRQASLTEAVELWAGMVNQSQCRPDDMPPVGTDTIIRPQVLLSEGGDVVLPPETLHQARLVPSLLHETFIEPLAALVADGGVHRLERWVAEPAGGAAAPSWTIGSEEIPGPPDPAGRPPRVFFVSEATGNPSTLLYAGPLRPAAVGGELDVPASWVDFRASVRLRWGDGVVAIEVRRASAGDLVRLTLDRAAGTRQLASVSGGVPNPLANDSTTFPSADTDVSVTIECVGDRVLVFQDAEPVFDVGSAQTLSGTIGLFAQSAGARFTEVRVDDLRPGPTAAFTFDFVTSKYATFHHHLHSFADRLLGGPADQKLTVADLSAAVPSSVGVPAAGGEGLGEVTDAERRAFEALEAAALGDAAVTPPDSLEIRRVSAAGAPLALLVRSPEPLLWERTLLEVSSSSDDAAPPIPGDVKLTDVRFGAAASDESVTVLLRGAPGTLASLAHHRLEWRPLPDTANPDPAWATYFQGPTTDPAYVDGTQLRVLAVSVEEAPQREPGTAQYFVSPDPGSSVAHFGAPGVELRLLGADGHTVVHQRRFRTADAYTTLSMRAVRKLDGTGLVLFFDPVGAPPPPAALRLAWKFTRARVDEALKYRQGGSETPEVAALDLVLAAGV